jgi:hypothetical protein
MDGSCKSLRRNKKELCKQIFFKKEEIRTMQVPILLFFKKKNLARIFIISNLA